MLMELEWTMGTGVAVESDAFVCKLNYALNNISEHKILPFVRMRSNDAMSICVDIRSGS